MNIHNHTILTKLKVSSKVWDEQAAWVRGYILALEDILGDLEREEGYQPMGGSTSQVDYRAGHELAVIRVWISVNNTLTQARATLATLEQMEQNHIDHVQRPEEQ